jgi:hypothetical protein
MAAKKTRKGATPARKPKKRASRPVKKTKKARAKPKAKARTKPKVRPATDILDVPPFLPPAVDNPPPPRFPPSPPPAMPFGNSFEVAAQMIAMQPKMSNAVLSTVGVVEPSLPLRTSDPNALHAKMIEQIKALEPEIADLRKHQQRRSIGDNNPPEPIEPAPLSAKELDEIRRAITVLKNQPPVPTVRSSKVKAALALLTKSAAATVTYVGKQADNFITAAVTKSGEEAGKWIVKCILVYELLQKLADTANQWWQSLPLPPL